MIRYKLWLSGLLLVVAVVLFIYDHAGGGLTLKHIHGLSFSAHGTRLIIPRHDGLAVYSPETGWSLAPGPQHDYMGFTVTRDALYSSGHPAPGSSLPNPFGLIKSTDGGQTWQPLGLAGEADFHLLAAGYQTNAIYVFSPGTNSRMPQPGLYRTADDGQHWQRAEASGLGGQIHSLAVHPTQAQVVAVGTTDGLFLSRDRGERFQPVLRGTQVLALSFTLDGEHLWVSRFESTPALQRLAWQTGQTETLSLPPLHNDAVSYMAQNPANPHTWAIATFQRDVYLSSDNGKAWTQIAEQGATR
jgi:photosystem II stability/assembly factor-like uncharacterized protein